MTNSVKEAYELIAYEFDKTRQHLWKGIHDFVLSLPPNSKLLDVGCGNGKNMKIRNDIANFGCDFCSKFVEICNKHGLQVIEADCRNLPYEDNSFDAAISVAVLHHLDSEEDRRQAMREMIRAVKPGGKIFVQVWADHFTMKPEKLTKLETNNDYLVRWQLRKPVNQINQVNPVTVQRFYHVFSEQEFKDMITFGETVIEKIFEEAENWCCIIYIE